MAKNSKKITVSSKREQEIEKSFLSTPKGKFIFVLMFINTIILLIGLLLSLHILVLGHKEIAFDYNLYVLGDKLLFFGACLILICLFYYISFSSDYEKNAGKVKPETKAVPKKTTSTKTTSTKTSKPATKTSSKTTQKSKSKTTSKK